MSTRQLRARLDRLTRFARTAVGQDRDGVHNFTIDPALAKALRNDKQRLSEVIDSQHGGCVSAAEVEEESRLRASIADRLRAIGCPAGYGPRQRRNDSNRLHELRCKRLTPRSCGGGTLTNAEDAEEAQLMARLAAYGESPEGRAQSRIFELTIRRFSSGGLSTAEQSELDSLSTLYPKPPLDPNDPLDKEMEAFSVALKEALKKMGD
jgi:hypothetical protein